MSAENIEFIQKLRWKMESPSKISGTTYLSANWRPNMLFSKFRNVLQRRSSWFVGVNAVCDLDYIKICFRWNTEICSEFSRRRTICRPIIRASLSWEISIIVEYQRPHSSLLGLVGDLYIPFFIFVFTMTTFLIYIFCCVCMWINSTKKSWKFQTFDWN